VPCAGFPSDDRPSRLPHPPYPPDRWFQPIRTLREPRIPGVSEEDPGRRWVVQPLLDAGVPADDVRTLLIRVTFECMVGGRRDISDVSAFLGEQPPQVRVAWWETVHRMLGTSDVAPAS